MKRYSHNPRYDACPVLSAPVLLCNNLNQKVMVVVLPSLKGLCLLFWCEGVTFVRFVGYLGGSWSRVLSSSAREVERVL